MSEVKKNKVLIVDDESTNIMALTHILNSDYTVYSVRNGKDAIFVAQRHSPDVILLDIMMPEMDGYAVLEELKKSEITQNIPVIFISSLSKTSDEEKGLALGASDYITKPFNTEIIKLRVQNQIVFAQLHATQSELINYKLASDSMSIALWTIDVLDRDPLSAANKITYSQEYRNMLGFADVDEFPNIFQSWAVRLHPDDKKDAINDFLAHFNDFSGNTPYIIQYRIEHKNGEYRHFDGFATTMRDSEGFPIRVTGTVRDITERKLAENSLIYRESTLSALNETAAMFLSKTGDSFEESMTLGVTQISDLFGIDRFSIFRNFTSPEELCTSQVYRWEKKYGGTTRVNELYTNIKYSQIAPNWKIILEDNLVINGPVRYMQNPEKDILKSVKTISAFISPVFTENVFWGFVLFEDHKNERYFDKDHIEMMRLAALLCANMVMRNETERKVADANTRLALMLDATPMCCQLFDSNFNKIDCNQEALRLFGFKDKIEFFRRFTELYPERQPNGQLSTEMVKEQLVKALEEGYCTFDWVYTMLDGTFMPAEATLVRLSYGNDYVIAGYTRDMRADIKMQEEMHRAAVAEETSRMKSTFLANMSHEIRTPMNAILGISEILSQNKEVPDEMMDGLRRIVNSSSMLLGIINDILELSKIEAGKLDIISEQYSTVDMINDSIHLNIMRIGEKSIEFIVDVDENIPVTLIGDELRIKQILNNFLSNAFKFTEAGNVTLSVTSKPRESLQDDNCVNLIINVSDTGYGMSKDQLEKLFDEYSRFNQEATRTIEGTGLGLAIAKHLTNLMGGDIKVDSTPGTGSTFTLRLPQINTGTDVIGHELAARLTNYKDFSSSNVSGECNLHIVRDFMPYGSVLLVDDVETNLYVAQLLLKPYKLQIEAVSNAFDAIKRVESGKVYDVIFMDHMMPKMNGMEATKILRDFGYTEPIVALTANALVGQEDIFLENGFDAFLSKPIDLRQLNAILNKLVRDKQPPEVIDAAKLQAANIDSSLETDRDTDAANAMHFDTAAVLIGKEIHGLDILEGLSLYDGDVDVYLRMLRLYSASTSSLLDQIVEFSEESLSDYQVTVHGIKGSSLNLFASEVGNTAECLEKAAKKGDIGFILENNVDFLENARKLIGDINNLLVLFDNDNSLEKKDKPDPEILKRLLTASEAYDIDVVNDAMDELAKYSYYSDNDLVKWLRDMVDLMNYPAIIDKLNKIGFI
ncbi:MAG: response regulator [Oscillospiraceae bacterium]|nr:response regulator [Oscillospiraceae bacterium]